MERPAIRYLDNTAVLQALAHLDEIAVVREALVCHARGDVILPPEAAMRWRSPAGNPARSLALPAAVGREPFRPGLKVINANPANVDRGMPRASGLVLLFDPETAGIVAVLQAEHISSRRTAAVSALAVTIFAPEARSLALIGCGALARAHLELCGAVLADLVEVRLFDQDSNRADALRRAAPALLGDAVAVSIASDAEAAVGGADVVIPVTTTTTAYLSRDWLARSALVVNVSLDDCEAEVLERCALLVVDDWSLVSADTTRLLGRLIAAGRITGPGVAPVGPAVQQVAGELGSFVADSPPSVIGRDGGGGLVVVNPFGMGICDVALAAAVNEVASSQGLGVELPT